MRRLILLTLVLASLLLATLSAKASPDVYTDDSFSSSYISLSGTEVVRGNVRLLIVPENWLQTNWSGDNGQLAWDPNQPTRYYDNDNIDGRGSPGIVRLTKKVSDNWNQLTNAPLSGDWGMWTIGVGENVWILKGGTSGSPTLARYNPAEGWSNFGDLTIPWQELKRWLKNGCAMAWDNGEYIYVLAGGSYSDYPGTTQAGYEPRYGFWRFSVDDPSTWVRLDNTPWWHGPGDSLVWVRVRGENYIYAWLGTTSKNCGAKPAYAKFYRYHITPSASDGIGQWETTPIIGIQEWGISSYPYGADDGSSLVWTGGDNIYFSPGAYNEGYSGKEYYWGRFIISSGTWQELAHMPYNVNPSTGEEDGVDDGGTFVYDGADFIYGLKGGDSNGSIAADNFWRYRISADTWEVLAGVSKGVGERTGARLAATTDGNIYVWIGYGGAPGTNSSPSNEFWMYNPPTYRENGWLESSVFDAGVTSIWQTINWNGSSTVGVLNKKRAVSAEPDNLVDNENRLGACFAENEYGNGFVIGASPTSADVTVADQKASWRFVAQASKTVAQIRGYFKEAGTSPTYTVMLENDNNGYPSGTLAWTGAENTLSIAASGWATVNISDGAVTENAVYHIVLVPGAPDTDNYIGLMYTKPFNSKWINGVTKNDNRNTLFYDGTDWLALDAEPVYVLDYSDGTYEGNPYYDYDLKSVYADNYYGEQFTPSTTVTVTKISFYTARRYAPPDNLYVELATTAAVIENGSLGSAATIGTSLSWYSYTFSTPRTLSAGTTYRAYLKSPGATSSNYYKVWALDAYSGAPYENLTYDNTNSVLCKYTGGAWSTESDKDASFVFTTRVTTTTAYERAQSMDGIYEEISENNLGTSRVWSQDNWSGGATTPTVESDNFDSTYSKFYENENISATTDVRLKIGWENLAAWPGTVGSTVACYAENSGVKYIYALESKSSPKLSRFNIATGTWENAIYSWPVTTATGSGMVWTGGDNIYVLNGGTSSTFYRYRFSTGTATAVAAPGPNANAGSGLAYDGGDNIYAVINQSGIPASWIYVYQISTNTWTLLDNTRDGSGSIVNYASGSSICGVGGYIYGQRGGVLLYYRYSIADNTWANITSLPSGYTSGSGGAQEKYSENFIYFVRGNTQKSFLRYSIPSNSWVVMTNLPDTVLNPNDRLAFDGTYLYMIRGYSDNSFWRYSMFTGGSLESSVYDAKDVVSWGVLTFDNSSTESENTSVIVKVRTGTDSNPYLDNGDPDTENWLGWQEFGNNVDLPYENRYLQYMVELGSSKPGLTPVFDNTRIDFSEYRYALRWEHRITGVENTYDNAIIQIYGYNETGDENIIASVWKQSAGGWENFAENLPLTPGWTTHTLTNINDYLVDNENISVKFQSADNVDNVQTTIFIDYVALEAQKSYSTSLRVWTRSSSDNSTWSGWLENASGDSLPYENRYIGYRVQLSTNDEEVTPTLHELYVTYVTKTPREGTFTSQPLELGYVDNWGTLSWQGDTPSGTSISFATRSSEDGRSWTNWQELGSGSIESPSYGLRYLQVKATLQGIGVTSPTLYSYSIDCSPDRTPPSITLSEPSDGFTTTESYITFRGEVSDTNPMTFEVNGQAILFAPGSFSARVWLNPGMNTISLTARDVAGNECTLTIRGTMIASPSPVEPEPSGPSAEQVVVVAAVAAAGVAALVAAWAFLGGPLHPSSGSFRRRHM